jgi:glycosyltransferase involved in cell wall biosynthesis
MTAGSESSRPLLQGKRLVFVLAGEVLGGAERGALELARDLALGEGASVRVCALDGRPGPARGLATEYGIPWTCVPTPWTGSRAHKAASLVRVAAGLRRMRPDVLVSATNLPNVVCGLTWRATGAPLCVWHQCDVFGSVRIGRRLFRRALHATPVVIAAASHGRDWLVEQFDVDPRRVHLVRTSADLPPAREDRATYRARLGLDEDDFVACMLAHLHSGKDHATLLHAWRLVVDRLAPNGRRPVVLFAGRDAGGGNAAKALAFDLDLRDYVRFLGEVDDVRGLLEACDLGILSSRSEMFARAVAEPMGVGLAVAGTDVPGIREVVGTPGEPFLAPPGDAPALADAILRLALDADLRARIGRANAELIAARQSHEATSHVYAALLADELERRGERT